MIPKVAVCLPLYRDVHAHTLASLLGLRFPSPPVWSLVYGQPTDEARNEVTRIALQHDVTHVLSLDGDVVFPPDALERLLAHGLPIVSGLYWKRTPPYAPLLMYDLPDGKCRFRVDVPSGLVEVDATGGGFLLARREVFDAIGAQLAPGTGWWDRIAYPGGVKPGEDIAFCRRARAAGFKVLVDCDLRIGHRGEITFDQDVSDRLCAVEQG